MCRRASFPSAAWWMTIPPGLIITAILVVNNLRDLENDRKAKKHTLAVMFGERFAKIEYLLCMLVAILCFHLPPGWESSRGFHCSPGDHCQLPFAPLA